MKKALQATLSLLLIATPQLFSGYQGQPWKTTADASKIAATLQQELKKEINKSSISKKLLKHPARVNKALITRHNIPADANLYITGDLHGDFGPIAALLSHLENQGAYNPKDFTLQPDTYLAYLGDYIDRGKESLKNLWFLTQLKATNPSQVFLVRGNHETTDISRRYGFWKDLEKLKKDDTTSTAELFRQFQEAFALLPVITIIDRHNSPNSRIALLHGGIDITKTTYNMIPEKSGQALLAPLDAQSILWSDMRDDHKPWNEEALRGTGSIISQDTMNKWMQRNNISMVIRGHQQADVMYETPEKQPYKLFSEGEIPGIGARWNWRVVTLNVAPNTGAYGAHNGYFTDYGTILHISPTESSIASTAGIQPKIIPHLPGYQLTPIYFAPKAPHAILDRTTMQSSYDQVPANTNLEEDSIIQEPEPQELQFIPRWAKGPKEGLDFSSFSDEFIPIPVSDEDEYQEFDPDEFEKELNAALGS